MPVTRFDPPARDEYAPYYHNYIGRVPPGDLLTLMRAQIAEVRSVFGAFTPERADFTYAPGKWTVKEVLGHLIDTERVFAFRALSIARGDPAALPSWEQDTWIAPARFAARSLEDLIEEWVTARQAAIALFEGLPWDAPTRRGVASGNPISVRALVFILPGHLIGHLEFLTAHYL